MTAIQLSDAARPPMRLRLRGPLRSAGVVLAVLVLWEILAVTVFAGRFVVPSPTAVVTTAFKDNLYLSDLKVTLLISWKGYVAGNGAALLLAAICLIVPAAENALMTLGVATYCVPTIAVGPLFVVLALHCRNGAASGPTGYRSCQLSPSTISRILSPTT